MTKLKQNYKFRQVMDVIVNMVKNELLNPGDKVPSLRRMSEDQSVSISTVMQAYMELESVGILEAKPQSGFYVSKGSLKPREQISRTTPSKKPVRVTKSEHIQKVLHDMMDPDIIPLGCAIPSADLLPHKELLGIMKRVLNMERTTNLEYGDTQGDKFFRQQLAYYMNMNGNDVHSDNIIVTNGASEGMSLALRALTSPGDLILMESPSYFGFMHLLETSKVFAMELPTCPEWGIDLDDFYQAVKKYGVKAFLTQPNFGNPLGHTYPEEVKKEIVEICTRYNVPVIEDDINGDFAFNGKRGSNLKKYDKEGNVIHISSFSKTLSSGMRIGWIEAGKYFDDILRQKIASSLATNEINQLTIAHYLASGKYPRHLRRMNNAIKNQVENYKMKIFKYFPEGTKVSDPQGGFVLWVELPDQVNTDEIFMKAVEENISFTPGGIFSSQERYTNCMRINCGFPLDERIERGIERLGEMCRGYL
ncbi:transcriptional regulator, GntR family with aminotransferase domain [Denitrovibrio acetiphilus DSM 12809]|uniref:Transcriptional regulator, GntR family with aminotransferase domain n=1 Tax=Denitrovibrio acetiphilus (strain DSM 12809 / NBRC 114555 / N2460) TaxID=522772 RepID=D4H6G9_DENA2|nr:PLP-dependent aminotransferase family protein [Denitrovibrio acetiphilus]ADD69643.1 transcriptional regulator, GntR family with aminotransferase domain [Denitrovibrio acetiphilus DSM 12809]